MQPTRNRSALVAGLWLLGWSVAVCQHTSQPADAGRASSVQNAPLPVGQVARKLEERDAQRASALAEFRGTRVYHMQYYGFPGGRDAEMVVKVTYRAPDSKQFTVVSQRGSSFIIDHVFKKLMQSEQEYISEENRRSTALSTENYQFTLAGYETTPNGPQYVLNLQPRNSNRFLYRGKICVDAKDFAVVRIEAEPARNPSWWIRKTEIRHKYIKVDDFWLPAEDHTESVTRMGGRAVLSIEYKDYAVTKASPVAGLGGKRETSKRREAGSEPAP